MYAPAGRYTSRMSTPTVFADAWILTGCTGAGKSSAALELAEAVGAEIVALDSMTVYRGMDIGTAKPTREERERIPHHLIDVLDPWERGDVAWWLRAAEAACAGIVARGKRPLFVGGTPFYLKALTAGLFAAPPADAELRRTLEAEAVDDAGKKSLHDRLAAVDAKTALRLHPNDVRRVVRALEIFTLTGRPISGQQTEWNQPNFGGEAAKSAAALPVVCLDWPRDILNARIDARIDAMLAAGWPAEAEGLLNLSHPVGPEAGQALGYKVLWSVLRGEMTLAAARVLIQTQSKQFAKRQRTWFRSLLNLRTLHVDAMPTLEVLRNAFAGEPTVQPPGE